STAGTMVGTPAFMSPEQIQGLKIDRRTDIFSAGVVLYQLLTGEQPFKGEGAWTVARQIMQDDPPPPSSVVLTVAPEFDAVIHKALAKTPAQRFATAGDFAKALRGALANPQIAPSAAVPRPKAKEEPRASETELEFWRAIQNSSDPAEFEFYLEQFPSGTYSQLARHKILKLREPIEAAHTAAEEKARREAEEGARKEAEDLARHEAEEEKKREAARKARLEAEAVVRREAEAKARREAEDRARLEKARQDALEKAKREAVEKAKREVEEKARQAKALAKLKQQQEAAARAKAAVNDDATVAIASARPAATPSATQKKSFAIPAIAVAAVIVVGVIGYVMFGRTPAPVPAQVAEAPPIQKAAPPAAPAIDAEKIGRETEDRVRKEFAEKAATDQAALEKALAEKAAAEKLALTRTTADKAEAEKAMQKAAADRVASEKVAAEKAAAAKIASDKAAAEKAAAEQTSVDKAAADRAFAQKEAAEKVAAAAMKPGWPSPGDRWVYEARDSDHPDSRYQIVVNVQEVTASTIRDILTPAGGKPVVITHKAGANLIGIAPGIASFSPYLRAFQEMRAGERWSNLEYKQLWQCGASETSCDASAHVVGKERVTVRAGSYETWKIIVELNIRGTVGAGMKQIHGSGELMFWYSDAVNRIVKYQSRVNYLNWLEPNVEMELVSYFPATKR
ncbi:MAG TPA: hypothetical protein VIF38_13980, partial [Burkholderiales bacterium]